MIVKHIIVLLFLLFAVETAYSAVDGGNVYMVMFEGEMMASDSCAIEKSVNLRLGQVLKQAGFDSFKIVIVNDYERFKAEGDRNINQFYKGSGFQYVQLDGKKVLLVSQYNGLSYYHSSIIVKTESKIHSLDEIKNKTYVFTSKYSASGYLYPRLYLADQGIFLDVQLSRDIRTATQVVDAVASGAIDVGFVYEGALSNRSTGKTIATVRELLKIPYKIVADPLWVNDAFYSRHSSLSDSIAQVIMEFQNGKGDPYYTLVKGSREQYDDMRYAYRAFVVIDRYKLHVRPKILIYLLRHLVLIVSILISIIILIAMDVFFNQARTLRRLKRHQMSLEETLVYEKKTAEKLQIEKAAAEHDITMLKSDLTAAEELLSEASRLPADTVVQEDGHALNRVDKESVIPPGAVAAHSELERQLKDSSKLTIDLKIGLLESLMRNFKLDKAARRDIEDSARDEQAVMFIFKDVIDFDRMYPTLPPSMQIQKYNAGNNVFEVRLSSKYRLYVCPNKKLIIRIDTKHDHNKIRRWLENSNSY